MNLKDNPADIFIELCQQFDIKYDKDYLEQMREHLEEPIDYEI